MMKAMVLTQYGDPRRVLAPDRLKDIPKPRPADNEVLIRISATSVNAGDWHLCRGSPWLLRLGFGLRPNVIMGMDVSGTIEQIGAKVDPLHFQLGAPVFAHTIDMIFGGFAEYVALPTQMILPKPNGLSFEEAAAIPAAGLTALQGLRDHGQLCEGAGQRVLINGASSGVGSLAVQIAKAFGAEVVAVCNGTKAAMVQSLGADRVIDYTQEDFTLLSEKFDIVLDCAASTTTPWRARKVLKTDGRYVHAGGSGFPSGLGSLFMVLFTMPITRLFSKQRVMAYLVDVNKTSDLDFLREMASEGKLKPHVDRTFALSEVGEAIAYLEERKVKGKIVIKQ